MPSRSFNHIEDTFTYNFAGNDEAWNTLMRQRIVLYMAGISAITSSLLSVAEVFSTANMLVS